jgi:hypothetical protein
MKAQSTSRRSYGNTYEFSKVLYGSFKGQSRKQYDCAVTFHTGERPISIRVSRHELSRQLKELRAIA